MRATLVVLAVAITLTAAIAEADPIAIGLNGTGGGAIGDVTTTGNTITFDLSLSLTNPVYVQVQGLDARQNYQVAVNVSGLATWTGLTAEILNPATGPGNERDPQPQPSYVPAGFSTSTDYDGFSFAQRSSLERSFLAGGGASFGVLADEITDARDRLTFTGFGIGTALLSFGLRDFQGERTFLIRLAPAGDPMATPEPASMLLIGTGLLAIARAARGKRDSA